MGMKLSDVQGIESKGTAKWGEQVVDFGYYAAQVTPKLLKAVNAAGKAGDMDVVGLMLAPTLAWWDVLDDNGDRIAPTVEFIEQCPLGFLTAVMEAQQEAMRPPDSRR